MLPRSGAILRCASCAVAHLYGEPGYPVTPWSLPSFQAWYARGELGYGRVGALRLTAAQLLEYDGLPAAVKPCAPVAFVPLVEGGPPVALWLYWEFLHREAPSAAHASGAGGVGSSGVADGASSSAAAQPPLPPCRRSQCDMTCAEGREQEAQRTARVSHVPLCSTCVDDWTSQSGGAQRQREHDLSSATCSQSSLRQRTLTPSTGCQLTPTVTTSARSQRATRPRHRRLRARLARDQPHPSRRSHRAPRPHTTDTHARSNTP